MSLPLFDEFDLPPDSTAVDVQKVPMDYQEGRVAYQGHALMHFLEETGEDPFEPRDWNDEEGIFVIVQNPYVVTDDVLVSGAIIGFIVVLDTEEV